MDKRGQLLGFNLWTLKLFFLWPENDHLSFLNTIKSNIFYFAPIYIGGATTLCGVLNQILVGFNDISGLIESTIGLVDSLGGFYMRFCFLKNVKQIRRLISTIDEFEIYCPISEIQATEVRVRLFTKGLKTILKTTDYFKCFNNFYSDVVVLRYGQHDKLFNTFIRFGKL